MDINLKIEIRQFDQNLQGNQVKQHNIKQLISTDTGFPTIFKIECHATQENPMNLIAKFIATYDNFYFPKF